MCQKNKHGGFSPIISSDVFVSFLASGGRQSMGYGGRHKDRVRKEEGKEKGNEGGQRPSLR